MLCRAIALVAALTMLLSSCHSVQSIDRASMEWDSSELWQQVANNPPAYVPKGLPRRMPLASTGEWIVDPQDGWQFFVPHSGAGELSRNIIRAEALKAVNKYSLARHNARNAGTIAMLPVKAIAPWFWMRGGSGTSGDDFLQPFEDDDCFPTSRKQNCKEDCHHHGPSHPGTRVPAPINPAADLTATIRRVALQRKLPLPV